MSDPKAWIGHTRTAVDSITERMLEHFRATLWGMVAPGDVPPGFHWCLAPDALEPDKLGRDGHPKPGLFLPDLPLPRRMWAGGELTFHAPLEPGNVVTRTSTISDVTSKVGRSGPLAFITLEHVYEVAGAPRITERQDIVYREDPRPGIRDTPRPGEAWTPVESWEITPTSTLLFRYSALTFNGHRIHYDFPYATEVEGYEGLVVHGPLQSVWMQNLATMVLGRLPRRFSYRGLAPLICGRPVKVEARGASDGLELRVRETSSGVVTSLARTHA